MVREAKKRIAMYEAKKKVMPQNMEVVVPIMDPSKEFMELSELESKVSEILTKNEIFGQIRTTYHAFAKRLYKFMRNNTLSPKRIDSEIDYYITMYGLNENILRTIAQLFTGG